MHSLELFAGAGGLALGTELAGFHAVAAVEKDKWAAETLEENKERGFPLLKDLRVICGDVRDLDYGEYPEGLDLVSGGPPCQPFSIGGKHRAFNDDRDMFSAFADVVANLKPRAFIIENVKGLTRATFANYLAYIEHRMSMPEVFQKPGETWTEHLKRLEQVKTSTDSGLRYNVARQLFDAADFGAAQRRERVFIVGFRSDQDVHWNFPEATHSVNSLLHAQWITGEYWERHKVPRKARGEVPDRYKGRVAALRGRNESDGRLAWLTVRDALHGLPAPRQDGGETECVLNHRLQHGARAYVGHTGSPIDWPSKALKAGDHGVPGGENMMVLPDGSVRYFTVREAARIQGFPDGYVFHGAWSESMRQLGNAVPVRLAQAVASSVAQKLLEADLAKLARRQGLH
ncbi:MAG: DNA (cytosine-5-)-methyltransferase [Rhodobacteraceae bacterium]|nr:DNA (cytosine-5-)-methyltransferase [Paracoccaceae bacterium]